MPTGIYLSNDRLQQLNGDLFEQDARQTIGDTFEQQATAALPSMVADQQDRIQQQQQSQRDALADQFTAAAPQMAADHLATLTPSDSLTNPVPAPSVSDAGPEVQPSVLPAPPPSSADPSVAAPALDAPTLTAPASVTPNPNAQRPIAPPQPVTPTTAGLSGGGATSGQIGSRGSQILSSAANTASWLGDSGVKAVQAVLVTEGGLGGARGDNGASAGPLQFYEGGQLANFAQQHGMSLNQAKAYVEQNPEAAIQWAIGTPDAPGYLGQAILAGQKAGLQGADLATYAQQHGQVSVSPERAGANYNAMFGGGQNPVQAAVQMAQQAVRDPSSILDAVKPFLGQPYVWGGKGPQQGFDCSGLAGWLTTGQPESTTSLYGKSASVGQDQAQPGDLVFWNMGSSDPHLQHVAVYLGNGQIVQSGGDQAAVNIGSVNQSIGSPPEFRRVGPGGAPAQATAAPPGAPSPADPTPGSQPASNPIDAFKQKLGDAFGDLLAPLQSIFGGGQQSSSGLGDALSPASMNTNPLMPSNILGGAEQAIGQNVVQPAVNALLPGGALEQGRQQLGATIAGAAPNLPVAGGVLQAAGGLLGAPSVLEQMQTLQDLAQKYPTPGDRFNLTPNFDAMTPEDRQRYSNAMLAVGGIVGEPGASFDKFGVQEGFVPPAAKYDQYGVETGFQPPPVTGDLAPDTLAPTLGRDVASTLPPGSGPLAPPAPAQESTTTLQGLLQMARSRGVDTSTIEAQLPEAATEPAPAAAGISQGSGAANPPAAPASAGTSAPLSLKPAATGPSAPPPPAAAVPPATPPTPPPGTLPATVGAVPPSVPTGGANAWDYLRALRVGSLAGGVQTIGHILLNAPLQTAFKLVSDAALSITRPETIPLEFMGAWQGLRGWATNAASAPLGQPGRIAQSIGGTAGQAVETGLLGLVKTHPVVQDMASQIGTSMELWRQAGIEASNAGLARFSGPWWTEVQNLVANPTADMAAAAQRAGETFSLRGPMGEMGQAFADLRGKSRAVDFIMPFFNIGYHVATQGIERSPVGLLGTAIDVARAPLGSGPYAAGAVAKGVTPLAERFRNNMIGTGLAIEAFHQASLGNITGNGPDDPKLKADLLATGWQPDSIRVGDRYFPLHVLGPSGWPLSEAANLYESTHTGDQGGYAKPNASAQDQFISYLGRMAQYGENETFLRSIGQLLQAAGNAKDFGRLGEQEAAGVLGSLIPQGALVSNVASSLDPYTRRMTPGDLGQAMQNRLPVFRSDLPLKLTPTGQPVQNASQGLGVLLPRSSIAAPDPVINAMGQAGIGAPTIPKTISVTSKYQMDLTPDEQQQWQQLHGQALNDQLKDVVTDPDWARLSVERQRQLIQKAMTNATDAARKQLLDSMPDDQIEARAQLKTDVAAGNRVTVGTAAP